MMEPPFASGRKVPPTAPGLLAKTFALVLSGAALATLVHLGLTSRSRPGELVADPETRKAAPEAQGTAATPPRPPPAAPTPVVGAMPSLPEAEPEAPRVPVEAPPVETREEEEATTAVVPNVVGLRLSAARRKLAAVGLRVSAHDFDFEPIRRDEMRYFRVTGQDLPVGRRVLRGTAVPLAVRDIGGYAEGY